MEANRPGFKRIQWLAVLLPALSVGTVEFLRHQWMGDVLPEWMSTGWSGNMLGALLVGGIVYGFVRIFIGRIRRSASETARAREKTAVVLERQRIAREMHDNVAQTLFYLNVKLGEASALVKAGENERASVELQSSKEHLEEAYQQTRIAIADLKKEADLEDFGEAVCRTVSRLAGRLGVRASCEIRGRPSPPATSRQHLLAIIQEALTNAHQHGRAGRASVRIETIGEGIVIAVSDDGAGFDPGQTPDGGYGLVIMEERSRMAGGELSVASAPGCGTNVTVRIPEKAP